MKSLADMLIANPYPRVGDMASLKNIDCTLMAKTARVGERYELDDPTTRMMMRLANVYPRKIKQYMELAWPAAPEVWIEYPSKAMLEARRLIHGPEWEYVTRSTEARTAMVISCSDSIMHLNCLEHDEDCRGLFPWLLGFRIHKEPIEQELTACGLTWGYETTVPGLSSLCGHAVATVHPSIVKPEIRQKLISVMSHELAGFVRVTLTALAMLNSPATRVGPPVRPAGRFVAAGGTHPYRPRRMVELALPKTVHDPVKYLEKTLATHHRRLHEVRAHYRHLPRQPNAPGWEPITIGNETLWRKAIARHLRGNPDLGVVEHEGVLVKGVTR